MAKQRTGDRVEPGKSTADYYKLNTKAIDDLISADRTNAPEVSAKELRRFGARRHLKLSQWLKALLIKVWFNGVVCYFFLWGLGTYIADTLDLWLVTAAALGFVTDLVTNNILRLTEKDDGASERWIMFPEKKKFITLPLNVIYAVILMALTMTTYGLLNRAASIGVEPILFGTIMLAWDLLLIAAKRLLKSIIADAREKADADKGRT